MKTILVTDKNINEFHPYQGTARKLKSGNLLFVVEERLPCVTTRHGRYFAIVTDWQPSANSLEMIRRKDDPEADTSGWKSVAETVQRVLDEQKESYAFNRWSIKQKFIPAKQSAVKMVTIGTDVSLDVCKGEGYMMMQYDMREPFYKSKEYHVFRYYQGRGRLKVDTYVSFNDLIEQYYKRKEALDMFAETMKCVEFDYPSYYDLLRLAGGIDSYCGLE